MRVGIDGRSLVGAYRRGIANYTVRVTCALADRFPEDSWLVLVPRGSVSPPAELTVRANIKLVRCPVPSRLLFGSSALLGRPRLDRLFGDRIDTVWMPAPAPIALSPSMPLVVTAHDISFLNGFDSFTHYEKLWHKLAKPIELLRRASKVVAVSNTTADLLAKQCGVDRTKLAVVPNGIRFPLTDRTELAADSRKPKPGDYILYVGALEPRKGVETLLTAYSLARRQGLGQKLLIAGVGRLATLAAGAPGVELLGNVSDTELEGLYRGATLLVAPSLDEGFGMVPLEALACGSAVMVSDIPAFQEVLGSAAVYVPPQDPHTLATRLHELVADPSRRKQLVELGEERVKLFSWERSAELIHETMVQTL